jgi:hypothetical protein
MMRLTIIVVDNAVGKDGVFYLDLNLSSCQIPSNVQALQWNESSGHIEFNTPIPNEEITSLPAWANACLEVWNVANTPIPPTPEQIIAENKAEAESLLLESDWSVLPDVPLQNRTEWEAYRAALRQIAINPTLDPVWPTKPQVIWQ